MKKERPEPEPSLGEDADTLRPEYDFSKGVRGVTAARFSEGANIVLLEPDVAAAFPNGAAVNKALRSLMHVTRNRGGAGAMRRGGNKAGSSG